MQLTCSKIPAHLYKWPLFPSQNKFQTVTFLAFQCHLNRCVVWPKRGNVDGCVLEQLVNHGCKHFLYCSQPQEELKRHFLSSMRLYRGTWQTNSLCLFVKDSKQTHIPFFKTVGTVASCKAAGSFCSASPEFCTEVSEGEVEGVRGRSGRPSGWLDPHHSPAICVRLHGKVAADLLHAITQLLKDYCIWNRANQSPFKKKKKNPHDNNIALFISLPLFHRNSAISIVGEMRLSWPQLVSRVKWGNILSYPEFYLQLGGCLWFHGQLSNHQKIQYAAFLN